MVSRFERPLYRASSGRERNRAHTRRQSADDVERKLVLRIRAAIFQRWPSARSVSPSKARWGVRGYAASEGFAHCPARQRASDVQKCAVDLPAGGFEQDCASVSDEEGA